MFLKLVCEGDVFANAYLVAEEFVAADKSIGLFFSVPASFCASVIVSRLKAGQTEMAAVS